MQVILEAIGGGAVVSEFNRVGTAARKAYGDTSVAAKDAAAGTGVFDRAASSISGKLKTLGVDANITGGMLKTGIAVGATAAGAAALKFGADSVSAFAEATGSVRAFQRVSGATAEDSSKLVAAMKQLGIDSDAGATSVFRLARNVADHAAKLAADNIQIDKNAQGNTDIVGTLMNVADAYNATQDPAQKAKIVFDAFGRSGAQMIPILQRGRDGLKELFSEADKSHEIFSQADLEKGRQFSLATKQLGEAVKGVEIEIGSALVPKLTELAHESTDAIHAVDSLAGSLHDIPVIGDAAGRGIESFIKKLNPLTSVTNFGNLFKGNFDEFAHGLVGVGTVLDIVDPKQKKAAASAADQAQATQEAAAAADAATAANAAEAKAIDGVINASVAAVNSTLGLERATITETTAVTTYNEKLAANAAAHGQSAAAATALRDAGLSLKEAMVSEAAAAVKLAQDQALARGETLSAHDAAVIFHDKLIELANTIGGPLHDQLVNLANSVNTLPDKEIHINVNPGDSVQVLDSLSGLLANVAGYNGTQVNIGVNQKVSTTLIPPSAQGSSAGGVLPTGAEGGLVSKATLAIIGEAGPELLLPLSKPARMAELLSQANLLKPFSMPSGGGYGGRGGGTATIVNVNVAGSVVTEHDLVAAVRKGVLDTKRRNGTAGLN